MDQELNPKQPGVQAVLEALFRSPAFRQLREKVDTMGRRIDEARGNMGHQAELIGEDLKHRLEQCEARVQVMGMAVAHQAQERPLVVPAAAGEMDPGHVFVEGDPGKLTAMSARTGSESVVHRLEEELAAAKGTLAGTELLLAEERKRTAEHRRRHIDLERDVADEKARLLKLLQFCSRDTKCTSEKCQAVIFWVMTKAGARAPVNPDGTAHYGTCKDPEHFRKKKGGK